jgi:DNA primase
MRRRGFADDELVDAGLALRRTGNSYLTDFYRDRVLIPVRDQEDKVAGFGRNGGDDRGPKYKNPPHTIRYDTSLEPWSSTSCLRCSRLRKRPPFSAFDAQQHMT